MTKRTYRVKDKRKRKRALLILNIFLALVLAFSSYRLIVILIRYRENRQQYDRIAALAVESAAPAPTVSLEPESSPSPLPSELPITVDWEALRAVNPDIAGWLYCEGTPINYPVVQTGDNERYLNTGFEQAESAAGALFFDCRNSVSLPDDNLIIYGHRMKDDSMFGSIPSYANESYLNAHPIMYLLTEAQSYRMEIFACRTVNAEMKYFDTTFQSTDDFARYLSKAVSQSYWKPEQTPDASGPILTLVTCSTYTHADDPRLLVQGRLIPIQ